MEESESVAVVDDVCIFCSKEKASVSAENSKEEGRKDNGKEEKDSLSLKDMSVEESEVASQSNTLSCNSQEKIAAFLEQVAHFSTKEESNLLNEADTLDTLQSLYICEQCLQVISNIVDKKACVNELEKKVKLLQDQLLEETQKLERQSKEHYLDMKKIEEIMKSSDVSKLECVLKVKKIRHALSEHKENNCSLMVNILRDSVLQVIQQLDDKYCDDDEDKVSGRRKSRRLKKKSRKRYFEADVNAENSSDMIMPLLHCTVKLESQGDSEDEGQGESGQPKRGRQHLGLQATGTPTTAAVGISEFGMEQKIKVEPDEEAERERGHEADGLHEHINASDTAEKLNDNNDASLESEVQVVNEIIAIGKQGHINRPRRKKTTVRLNDSLADITSDPLDIEDEQVDDEFLDTSDDDFFLDEGEGEIGSASESSSSSEDGIDSSEDEDWDDGEEYGRKKSKRAKKEKLERAKKELKLNPTSKKSRKEAYTKKMESINFSGMSKLKRKLIQRVLHKKYQRPTRKPKTPGKEEVDDPRLEHFIEYDSLFGTFSLDGIIIHVVEEKNEEGEDILCLECSSCGWRARPALNSRHPVDSFMYNHIAGQHLNLFQCVQCGSNLGGYKQYSDHVLGHRMGFACDVCGRPLGGSQALARHKWSHLSEEEAAELVAKGLKDPREKKESTKIYPCPTCGKIFPQRCQLKKHEKVHSKDRERITCELCGKLFLPSGFISHKRYYCFPEGVEHPRISCPLCPKVFKNKQFMQVHMDRAHNTERNHKCEQCGKGFKTKKDLMTHGETHTTERAFSCKKNCGRSYKTRKNCNAHEKRCDGRGGLLIQKFLNSSPDDRPFSCRKGCGRAYKTRRTLRGHERSCNGNPFVPDLPLGGGTATRRGGVPVSTSTEVTSMTVLGAALQASMEAVMGGGVIQNASVMQTTIADVVPEAVFTETVVTKTEEFN